MTGSLAQNPAAGIHPAADYLANRSAAVDALVERCRSGSVLVLTHWPEGDCYSLEPSRQSVPSVIATSAIQGGSLVGCHDGLLDGAPSQTWRTP